MAKEWHGRLDKEKGVVVRAVSGFRDGVSSPRLMSCALFFLGLVGLSGSSNGSGSDHFFFTGELKDGEGYATAAGQSQALG